MEFHLVKFFYKNKIKACMKSLMPLVVGTVPPQYMWAVAKQYSKNWSVYHSFVIWVAVPNCALFSSFIFYSHKIYADETDSILRQLQILQEDIKTLEKAVYSKDVKTTSSSGELSTRGSDILTQHLLKLSELEEQFKILTNSFEEINFKLDKALNLSS